MLLERDDALERMLTTPPEVAAVDFTPLDPSAVLMLSILELLQNEHAHGRAQVSFHVLCKRLEIRMSTLQRLMTALSEQALVAVSTEKERLLAALTAAGHEVAQALQAVDHPSGTTY